MKKFKTEKEVREFFKGVTFKFELMCDGVADYRTTISIDVNGSYKEFKVSVFPEENPFHVYDSFESLLGNMQIFEVSMYDSGSNIPEQLFYKKFVDYKNN